MTLIEQLLEHDRKIAAALIEAARALPDAALDEPVRITPPTVAFGTEKPTLRRMLNRLVFTHEMWCAAIAGHAFVESDDFSLDGMHTRLDGTDLASVVRDIAGPRRVGHRIRRRDVRSARVVHVRRRRRARRDVGRASARTRGFRASCARRGAARARSASLAMRTSRAARASAARRPCTPPAATRPRGRSRSGRSRRR